MDFYTKLDTMLADIVKKKLREDDLLSRKRRSNTLRKYGFQGIAYELLISINSNDITDFAMKADEALKNLNQQALYVPQLRTPEIISEISISSYLRQRNFSPVFTEQFERILLKDIGVPSRDFLVAHFSEGTRLDGLAELSEDMDTWVRLLLIDTFSDRFPELEEISSVLEPREIRYGSLEIFWALTEAAQAIGLHDEIVRGVLINGIYDIFKLFLISGAKLVFARDSFQASLTENEKELESVE